jgi:hypothetical protein
MDLPRRRAPAGRASVGSAAECWFLERGLPSVLTGRARWRRLFRRSAPVLAAYAALQACILAERLNFVFVLATSQLAQILVLAMITATIYLILGLIVLSPELLNQWTHTYKSSATVLGFTLPVPDSLIHMALFLGALTFMYISARAAGDAEYRSTFLDPLINDLRTTLIARNRYRGAAAESGSGVHDPET